MSTFRHTRDNGIYIDDLFMPLSFFITQEPAYSIPVGAIWQEYIQNVNPILSHRTVCDGITSQEYSGDWIDGNNYIANKATYAAAYSAYLVQQALPQTLDDAKTYKIGLLKSYWKNVRNGGVIYNGIIFPSDPIERGHWKEELEYGNRNTYLLNTHYIYDINRNKVALTLSNLNDFIDFLDEFYWLVRKNYDDHCEHINALTTINDVLNYDFTTEWPITPYDPSTTFYASYNLDLDADQYDGSPIGTAVGGAVVVNGWLDLAQNSVRYVDYNADGNADSQQIGTEEFIYKPNYSNAPSTTQRMITICRANADLKNMVQLSHIVTTGSLEITVYDQAGTITVTGSLGTWYPTAGTEYNIKLHYESGNTWLRINNVQFGVTNTTAFTRDTNINLLRIGGSYNSATPTNSNFYMKQLKISKV